MRELFYLLLCFFVVVESAAQKTEYFNFSIQLKKINYSVFDHVEFIDNRINQEYIGIKQKGETDHLAPVWLHGSLADEMKRLIDSAIVKVPRQPHTILINFRKFFISQYNGRFDLHMECYSKWEDGYWLVYQVDTFYKSPAWDLDWKVNRVVGDFIGTLVHLDLSKNKSGKPVSAEYLSNIDINEKKVMPAFSMRNVQRGVYYSYEEFRNNSPRLTAFEVDKRKDKLRSVFRPPVGTALRKKIPRDSIYAVSDGEHTWLAAPHEYARLNKRGLDFYFMASMYEHNTNVEEVSLTALFFGLAGSIIAVIPRKAYYEFRLNHLNGRYMLLRRSADR
jgi:hypothetical protein